MGYLYLLNVILFKYSSKAFIFYFRSFMKESIQFLNTFKCRILQLRNFAPHNSDPGPTDEANSYFPDYQFIWIYETYSVAHDWDGKAKQNVSMCRSH
jgi:hypothetical protein